MTNPQEKNYEHIDQDLAKYYVSRSSRNETVIVSSHLTTVNIHTHTYILKLITSIQT